MTLRDRGVLQVMCYRFHDTWGHTDHISVPEIKFKSSRGTVGRHLVTTSLSLIRYRDILRLAFFISGHIFNSSGSLPQVTENQLTVFNL